MKALQIPKDYVVKYGIVSSTGKIHWSKATQTQLEDFWMASGPIFTGKKQKKRRIK